VRGVHLDGERTDAAQVGEVEAPQLDLGPADGVLDLGEGHLAAAQVAAGHDDRGAVAREFE
jgi:hypothetical protein